MYELFRVFSVNLIKSIFFLTAGVCLIGPTHICGIVEFEEDMGSSNPT